MPSRQSIADVHASVLHFLHNRQTSGTEGVLKRAMFATQADMRRRPSLPIRWMHHCRRLFSAKALTPTKLFFHAAFNVEQIGDGARIPNPEFDPNVVTEFDPNEVTPESTSTSHFDFLRLAASL